ncbi:hypothetical protein, partial [Paraburkholderia tropica]|uniref:hypothetical protein n=1 Tax=Paraburkholderia tropica TaxID=92647 RepID=UPI001CC39AF6
CLVQQRGGEARGPVKATRRSRWIALLAVAVLAGAAVWYMSKPVPMQPELGQHVTAKYGPWLRSQGITAIRYEEGTWSITEKLTVNGRTVDLSSDCHSGMSNVCGGYYTLFLGGTDSFTLSSDGNGYVIQADIDRSKIEYVDSEKQFDKAMDDVVHDYEERQARLASWNKAAQ